MRRTIFVAETDSKGCVLEFGGGDRFDFLNLERRTSQDFLNSRRESSHEFLMSKGQVNLHESAEIRFRPIPT